MFFELLGKSVNSVEFVWQKREVNVKDFLDFNDETNTDIDMVI
jgi:hypothetical protein